MIMMMNGGAEVGKGESGIRVSDKVGGTHAWTSTSVGPHFWISC